ncbi:unnamed protein product [Paramecium pentaurelia]|uniref:Transmembrane protein n=1 Tax=Paramecium pentaurelia TaxID=43138 RepID=A0A8S1Y678_9CILI|nr:unnamed protein product [Paramecium pentaurelia]
MKYDIYQFNYNKSNIIFYYYDLIIAISQQIIDRVSICVIKGKSRERQIKTVFLSLDDTQLIYHSSPISIGQLHIVFLIIILLTVILIQKSLLLNPITKLKNLNFLTINTFVTIWMYFLLQQQLLKGEERIMKEYFIPIVEYLILYYFCGDALEGLTLFMVIQSTSSYLTLKYSLITHHNNICYTDGCSIVLFRDFGIYTLQTSQDHDLQVISLLACFFFKGLIYTHYNICFLLQRNQEFLKFRTIFWKLYKISIYNIYINNAELMNYTIESNLINYKQIIQMHISMIISKAFYSAQ